ncbi:hypothetical protein [Chromobacterium alticapitis]|uniref:hypothetical protein n=1 Tax=Chromobacterium alticapitis TaxID=2073169 RepID=UPI0011B00274|nr:hypothetical protein [Chromobacterium alticapitis]
MENKTFGHGNNWKYNACVGKNSGGDNHVIYMDGFERAVRILAQSSLEAGRGSDWEDYRSYPHVDAVIYPICFCARHHAELFIKNSIRDVGTILKVSD